MAIFKQYEMKDGSKKWMFQTYLGIDETTGKEKRTTRRGFKTKKEAQLEESRLQYEVSQNGYKKACTSTYNEVYLLWFEQYKNTVKESTWAKTQAIFKNHILVAYGQFRIDKIKVEYCQSVINSWFSHTKANYKMINNYASKIFDYAISIGIISDNPIKKISIPKVMMEIEENNDFQFYNKEELQEFFSILKEQGNKKAYTFFRLLAFSGIRKGEALALTWNDVNFKDKTLTINKTLTRGEHSRLIVLSPKTKKSHRTISLDDNTLAILKNWRTVQRKEALAFGYNVINKNQLVFTNQENKFLSPAKPRKWLVDIQVKHNLKKINVHGFRHTHCSLLFEAGASIKEVQDRLGHTDVQTTMNIYAHVTQKTKEQTALKFANYVQF